MTDKEKKYYDLYIDLSDKYSVLTYKYCELAQLYLNASEEIDKIKRRDQNEM